MSTPFPSRWRVESTAVRLTHLESLLPSRRDIWRADIRASTSFPPASPGLYKGLLCRFSELYFHEWASAVLGKGPRGLAAHAVQLPSFPSFRQRDVQTLDLEGGGERVRLGFLLHTSSRKFFLSIFMFLLPLPLLHSRNKDFLLKDMRILMLLI